MTAIDEAPTSPLDETAPSSLETAARTDLEEVRTVDGVRPRTAPVLDLVVPVFNEEATLTACVEALQSHLADAFPFTWRITIVDNASTDLTWDVARSLVARYDGVRALHLDRKGRGLALRTAWARSDAEVLAYTDVDLSTRLDALLPLVAPLVSGHSDVAIGSRLAPGARVARGPRRELISRCYNAMLRTAFATPVHDAQCGFKALRAEVAQRLLPAIEDDGWFFDTELLLLADHNGLRVHELPVDWVDDPDSRVDVVSTALGDLRGSARMAWRFATGRGRIDLAGARRRELADDLGRRLVIVGIIGTISTAVSLVIFLATRNALGALGANAVAIGATFAANAWANARFTMRARRVRWASAVGAFLGALALSSAALTVVHLLGGGSLAEVVVLLASWFTASLARLAVGDRLTRKDVDQ